MKFVNHDGYGESLLSLRRVFMCDGIVCPDAQNLSVPVKGVALFFVPFFRSDREPSHSAG